MIRVRILGTGTALPDTVISTREVLARAMPERDVERMRTRLGIEERRWAEPGTLPSELAADAVRTALEAAIAAYHPLGMPLDVPKISVPPP